MTWAEWVERQTDRAFDKHASRNDALNAAAWFVGRALHWHDADEGEAREIIGRVARNAGLPAAEVVSTLNRSLREGRRDAPLTDLRQPADKWATTLPTSRARVRYQAHRKRQDKDERAWRIRQAWEDSTHPAEHDAARAYLVRRGLDPHRLWAHDVARVRGADAPPWAHTRTSDANPLWAPVYNSAGDICNVRMRRVEGDRSTVGAQGVTMRGRILACEKGRRMLAGDATAARHGVLILEGEVDLWTWASRLTGPDAPALLAIPGSGSWSRELADRIPHGTRVAVLTDRDAAGREYRETIGRDLRGRCNAFTRSWTGIEGQDENDLAIAGRLPADPWDGLVPLFVEIEGVAVPVVERLPLHDLRERLAAELLSILNEPGAHVVVAPTGAGKSWATMRAALLRWRRGGWVRWSRREHASLEAARAEILKVADRMVARGELSDRDRADLDAVAIVVPSIGKLCEAKGRTARFRAATGRATDACVDCPLREACAYQSERERYRQALRFADHPDPFSIAGDIADRGSPLLWSDSEIQSLARRPWIRFTTHALEAVSKRSRSRSTDLHVVDESPHDALWQSVEITRDDIEAWCESGDLTAPDDTYGRVARLFRSSHLSAEIAAAFDGMRTPDEPSENVKAEMRARAAQTPHGDDYDPHDPDQRLTPHASLEALREALTSPDGWRGAYVYQRTLTIRRRLSFPSNAECRIYLDATADPSIYEPLEVNRWHVFDCEREQPDKVRHVIGPQKWTPHRTNVTSADTARRLNHLWDADDGATLYVMPRKLTLALDELGDDAPAGYLAARRADRVTYHGSAESRGANLWSHLTRVVVVAHHVPGTAVDAEAEWMGGDRAAAVRRLNVSPVVQAIGRVAREPGAQRHVEIMGHSPWLYGYEDVERVDADVEAWRRGAEPHGRACLAEWMREAFDQHATGTGILSLPELWERVQGSPLPPRIDNGGSGVGLAHWQKSIENAYMTSSGGGLVALFRSAELGAMRVRMGTNAGGVETVLAFAGWEPTPGELEAWARQLPEAMRPRWLEWGADGAEHRVTLWDPVQAYEREIRALAVQGRQPSRNAVAAEHAARGGAHKRRTVYNHLAGLDAEIEAFWQACRDEAEASLVSIAPPDPGVAEAFDERAAILEVDAGKPRDEAEREAARLSTGRASDVYRLRREAGEAPPPRCAWDVGQDIAPAVEGTHAERLASG